MLKMVDIVQVVTFISLFLLAQCAGEEPQGVLPSLPNTPATAAETDSLANATYSGIFDQPVTLSNGRWEGDPFVEGGASRPSVGLVEDFQLTGDIDDDGSEEIAVVLWENSGGSGTRSYLAVMSRKDDQFLNLATAFIGDRVALRSGFLSDGRIELDVVQQGPNDAACCPSQKASRTWTFEENSLEEGDVKIMGTLSSADLGGEWVLTHLQSDEPIPPEFRITLNFSGDQVNGKNACNSYFGGVRDGKTAGDLTFGQFGSTMMSCPEEVMDLEQRYFQALSNVTTFGFAAGKLALTWQEDGVTHSMLFATVGNGNQNQ